MVSDDSLRTVQWFPSRRVLAVGVVALMMVVAGCGGGGGGTATPGTTEDTATAEEASPTPEGTTAMDGETTGMTDGTTGMTDGTTGMNGTTAMMDGTTGMEGTTETNETTGMADGTTEMDGGPVTLTPSNESAFVRVAHMGLNASAVDVYLDNQSAFTGVEYTQVTQYANTTAGLHSVAITAEGNRSNVLFEGNLSFQPGLSTVTAAGVIAGNGTPAFGPLVLEDERNTSGENASVRLVHVSPDADPIDAVGPVDITVNSTGRLLFDNATYGDATEYVEVPAGNYTLDVRTATANDTGQIIDSFDVSAESGAAYTAFATGFLTPEDNVADTPFELVVTQDGRMGMNATPGMGTDGTATPGMETNGTATPGMGTNETATPDTGTNETGNATETAG